MDELQGSLEYCEIEFRTLRDWFAGMYMSGLMANRASWTRGGAPDYGYDTNPEPRFSDKNIAEWAYRQADAMLAERNKELVSTPEA